MSSFFAFFLFFSFRSNAQGTYPVSANIQLTPPYTVYMSDFVSPAANKLFVSLLFNDLTDPSIDVYLRFTIEGVGVTIQNSMEFRPPQPLRLQSGTLERLDASLLATYFDPNNLNFQGYTKQQYQRSAALPEGFYKISVQVYEYTTGVLISNKATYSAWLMLNDPPRVISPTCGDKIRLTNPQNIVFQWVPMHMASPVVGEETEYYFKMVQILPAGRNPNDAILSSVPVFEFTTENSSFLYGMDDPLLIPGQQYAWRVQAKYKNGKSMFKNDGYSQVCSFTYGDPCTPPADIVSTVQNESRVNIGWTALSSADGYTLRYKEKNNSAANWYENQITASSGIVSGITSNTTYEYQVQTTCGVYQSDWSVVDTFRTTASTEPSQCGVTVAVPSASTSEPLMNLLNNDVVTVDGFKVRIIQATGSNGIYTGSGVAYIPFLSAYVKMTFSSIAINKEFIVTQGKMVAVKSNKVALYRNQVQPKVYRDICTGGSNGNGNGNTNTKTTSSSNKTNGAGNSTSAGNVPTVHTIILNDKEVIQEGDTITVNGKQVIVDQNTQINPGDVVIVNGKTITVSSSKSLSIPESESDLLAALIQIVITSNKDSIVTKGNVYINQYNQQTVIISSINNRLQNSQIKPVASPGPGITVYPASKVDSIPKRKLTSAQISLLKQDPEMKSYFETADSLAKYRSTVLDMLLLDKYIQELNDTIVKKGFVDLCRVKIKEQNNWKNKMILAIAGTDPAIIYLIDRYFKFNALVNKQEWE